MFSLAYAEGAEWNDSHFKHERFNKLLIDGKTELGLALARAEVERTPPQRRGTHTHDGAGLAAWQTRFGCVAYMALRAAARVCRGPLAAGVAGAGEGLRTCRPAGRRAPPGGVN